MVSELEKSKVLEPWHLDLWQNLISEFGLWYKALVASCEEKNISAAAWLTRSVLELTVWVTYCVRSRDDAKRFYDDKARDVFDVLDHLKVLAKLGDKPDFSLTDLIDEARKRIADRVTTDGYEQIDETYQRVHNAAQQVGLGPLFGSMNKLFSKFAHPTAMMVFSYPDEAHRAQASVVFLTLGIGFCTASMAEFEQYAKAICPTTTSPDSKSEARPRDVFGSGVKPQP